MLSLCPLKDGSIDLVLELINQTIGFVGQENLNYFHIGADEIFNIGSCSECKLFCQETNHRVLYAKFLRKVVKKLSKKYPLEFIAWDDMYRGWSTADLDRLKVDNEQII